MWPTAGKRPDALAKAATRFGLAIFKMDHFEIGLEQLAHFRGLDAERWPARVVRRAGQGDKQPPGAGQRKLGKMKSIALSSGWRQGNQCRSVIESANFSSMLGVKVKEVATPQLQAALTTDRKGALLKA